MVTLVKIKLIVPSKKLKAKAYSIDPELQYSKGWNLARLLAIYPRFYILIILLINKILSEKSKGLFLFLSGLEKIYSVSYKKRICPKIGPLKSKAIKKNLVMFVKASIPLLMFWRKISFCLYRNSSKSDKKDNPNFVTLSMEDHGNKRNLNDSSVLLKQLFMKEVITNGRMIKSQEEIFSQHTKVHLLLWVINVEKTKLID